MDMKHDFPTCPDAPKRPPHRRRLQPESVAIMGIVASFWIFVLLRLLADAIG